MKSILSETFAPPMIASTGRFGLAISAVDDFQFLRDEQPDGPRLARGLQRRGHGDHAGIVSLWQVPKASLT